MPANPLTDPNWAPDLADTVERVVGTIRDKTTNNVILVARGLVFGLLAGILGLAVAVLAILTFTRGLQTLLELGMSWERAVYVSYFILGGICCLVGLLLMRKRHPRNA
jgi:biopolymer transport protein ExbB/TolQ